jgi:hypothetical protein
MPVLEGLMRDVDQVLPCGRPRGHRADSKASPLADVVGDFDFGIIERVHPDPARLASVGYLSIHLSLVGVSQSRAELCSGRPCDTVCRPGI